MKCLIKNHVSPNIWAAATPWNRYQNVCEEDEELDEMWPVGLDKMTYGVKMSDFIVMLN